MNVTKDQLVDALASQTELTKKKVEEVIEGFVDEVTKQIKKGNKVMLTGFGTFCTSKRAARMGINPHTKEPLKIPAMSVPKFTAGKALKDAVK
jgi:DNA-binding protein HU-beta